MARITNAQLQEQVAAQAAQIDQLIELVTALNAKQQPKNLQPVPKKQESPYPWLSKFPDYGTPAQRVEFDKLAARAAKQHDAIEKAMGVTVKCFIPVPKEADKMPHGIKWAGSYAK